MDKDYLTYIIKSHNETIPILAEAMGMSRQNFYQKMNEKDNEFKRSEIDFIRLRYTLSLD